MSNTPAYGAALRDEWGLEPDFLTVNHGSYGATPKAVLAEQDRWRRRMEAQPTRFFSLELPGALREAAGVLGKFIGAPADDVAFSTNASTGTNAVLRSMKFAAGDEILYVSHVYNAVRNTVAYVAEQTGAKAVVADIPFPRPDAAGILASIERSIGKRTRIAVIDHGRMIAEGTPASIALRKIPAPCAKAVSHSGALRVSSENSCDSANEGNPRMVPSSAPAMVHHKSVRPPKLNSTPKPAAASARRSTRVEGFGHGAKLLTNSNGLRGSNSDSHLRLVRI